jgi:hypothetical protein
MIAEKWHCKPREVDSEPWYEIANELDFMRIERDVAAWKKQAGR